MPQHRDSFALPGQQNLTLVDPHALLGIGALLSQIGSDREIALLAASAITAALQVELGTVVLRGGDGNQARLFGQFRQSPLDEDLIGEIKNWVSASPGPSSPSESSREIEVDRKTLPRLHAAGLRRLLVSSIKTVEEDFGAVLAGSSANVPYRDDHYVYLETLASQAAIALQRWRLDEERAATEAALRKARDELEIRVQQRTAELSKANELLQQEIHKRKHTEAALREQAKRLATLREIDRAILAESTVETIAEAALSRIQGLIPCHRAVVVVFHLESNTGTVIAARQSDRTAIGTGTRFPLEMFGITDELRQGTPRVVEDALVEPRLPPLMQRLKTEEGLRSYLHVPLIRQGELIGFLGVGSRSPSAFSSEHFPIGREVADSLAIAIQQARLARRVELHAAELEGRVAERTKELESFTYSVSHDLRAPLRAIEGFSRVFIQEYSDRLDDEGKRLLDIIRSNAQNMGQLIDDLLAFSRLGRQEMNMREVDMEEMARSVFHNKLMPVIGKRKIKLHIRSLPPAYGDPAMIRQVLVNLLSNGVKFTRARRSAFVEIGSSADGAEIVYHVKDNGVGFDMQYVDKLFGVFQRLHTADEFEGTGVGLAIVQRIVERHGGRVWAEGKENKGATIYFTLARKEDAV